MRVALVALVVGQVAVALVALVVGQVAGQAALLAPAVGNWEQVVEMVLREQKDWL